MSDWAPTHVQVTVIRAKNLIPKLKSGECNNAFVKIQLGHEKYETSVLDKVKDPEWNEECELRVTDLNDSIVLSVYHKHTIGTDFLGRVELPLAELNFYDRPKNLWFPLRGKAKKNTAKEEKPRGELEIRLNFSVQKRASTIIAPNLLENAGKKTKSGLRGTLSKAFGSVRDLNSKRGSLAMSRFSGSQLKINEQSEPENSFSNDFGLRQKPSQSAADFRPPTAEPSSRILTSGKKNDEISFTAVDINPDDPESPAIQKRPLPLVSVTKASSFSRTKLLVSSVVNTVSGATIARTQSQVDLKMQDDALKARNARRARNKTLDINSIAAEVKRNESFAELDQSKRSHSQLSIPTAAGNHKRNSSSEPVSPEKTHYPRDLMRKYGHLEKAELIARLAEVEKQNAEQQVDIDRLTTYIEQLMLRVLETAPKLLQMQPTKPVADMSPRRW